MFKPHYHLEVLTDAGFSVSTQHWEDKSDAVKAASEIPRSRTFWLIYHSHHENLHQHGTGRVSGW